MRRLAAWQRKAVLQHVAARCRDRAEELAQQLTIEAGKPIKYSRLEVSRLIDTLEIAAEESVRIVGEVLPHGYHGARRRATAACGSACRSGRARSITPWNFPLNLVAHKIAPAIACGCPFVLKPASATPIGALTLGEILAETDLPEGAFSILPLKSSDADALVGGRADQKAQLHRLDQGGLGAARSGPQEACHARARRQRGVHHRSRRGY